eukprot:45183_1
MARSIRRKSLRQRQQQRKKYGYHKYDDYFYMSRATRKFKKGPLYTAYIRLKMSFVLGQLRMSRQRLQHFKLKQINHSYFSNKTKKGREQAILEGLDVVRADIQWMLRNKGDDIDFGYSDLRLASRIISAKYCYEETSMKGAYFYGDIDSDESTEENDFFLMRSEDDDKRYSEIER